MKWQVKVKPNSRNDSIEKLPDGSYKVCIKAPPIDGKANEYLIRFLTTALELPKGSIKITSGHLSNYKRLEIGMEESVFLSKLDAIKTFE